VLVIWNLLLFFEENIMKIIAIMGSPRSGGNTDLLLDAFLRGVKDGGGEFEKVSISDRDISPCWECLACEETGECVIPDDTQSIYRKLLKADKIVLAAPNFFYGFPAQIKALIDRCQFLWAQKHILNRATARRSSVGGNFKPDSNRQKEAFALLLGATGGNDLFDGQIKTIRYFLEPLDASLTGSLLFRTIEKKGDILRHPTALDEAYQAGRKFIASIK
jgi:multimeric flavodoxin WrbA